DEVKRINATGMLPSGRLAGGAVLDDRTLTLGCHHQKILIVNSGLGLTAFCGGIDINPDRVQAAGKGSSRGSGSTPGAPLHDVHCRIAGPAAWDLLRVFVERWGDHPEGHRRVTLRGASLKLPDPLAKMTNWVQIGRTYPNGKLHAGIARAKD